jgi:hypothetical protein
MAAVTIGYVNSGSKCFSAAFRPDSTQLDGQAAQQVGRMLEAAALAEPRRTMTPAEIRALAAESIASLQEVAGKLADLSALLDDEAAEGRS